MNIRNFTDGQVQFKLYGQYGSPVVVMEGQDMNGKFIWDHLIDPYNGQPRMRTS
ncbi:MAG: hypothetical protein U1D98_01650 [Candidatus Gracilibacteria bacterium]|nr:hypothetical protein [Candidatus Gracilibacteria bacterium]